MANTVNLEFAGDASKLAQAGKKAESAVEGVGDSATSAASDFDKAAKDANNFEQRMGSLGAATTGLTDAVDSLGGGMQAVADIQDYARDKAAKLARANVDVMQATEDMAQATRDGAQATIDADQAVLDATQAKLDQKTALDEYNEAVKKHGKNSDEARQADIDLKQAGIDLKQATEDSAQATRDASQANIDAKGAQVDLNDAMHEANPPELQEWADKLAMVTPLLTAMMGATALVTAAQWAWNAAQLASPTTWIVLAVIALVAVIVLIATKTTWFQDIWNAAWGGIKKAASAVGSWFKDTLWGKYIKGAWNSIVDKGKDVWEWFKDLPGKLKGAFAKVTNFITAPFRAAFNLVSDAWNNTVGRLSWTVPNWVPKFGGNSISAPQLPKFHAGGVAPGLGQEYLAVLQGGERVTTRGGGSGEEEWIRVDLGDLGEALLPAIAKAVGRRGGRVSSLGIRVSRGVVTA